MLICPYLKTTKTLVEDVAVEGFSSPQRYETGGIYVRVVSLDLTGVVSSSDFSYFFQWSLKWAHQVPYRFLK